MGGRMKDVVEIETDVLVIGGGFAGMWAAIAARQAGQQVVLVEKAVAARSGPSSFMAGILLVCMPGDDKDGWFEEMVVGGEYLNDQEWVKILLDESYERAVQVQEWARQYGRSVFETDASGAFLRKRARGHHNSAATIVQARPFVDVLKRKAKELGVRLVERVMVNDLLLVDGKVGGAFGFAYRTGESYLFRGKAVIVASGATAFKGILMAVKNITGDGVAAAFRAGAVLQNMEMFTCNTCSADYDTQGMNLMVAVGGEFVNGVGERFMQKYDPLLGNRADLHQLTLAFSREAMEGRGPVYLDATSASAADRELCRRILPETFETYDRIGYSPFDRPMKWVPGVRGHVANGGGIAISTKCETNIPGLFAAGDAAFRASNGAGGGPNGKAVCFAVVSGHRAGRFAAEYASGQSINLPRSDLLDGFGKARRSFVQPILRTSGTDPDRVIRELQELVTKCEVFYIKSEPRIEGVINSLCQMNTDLVPELWARDLHELVKANEVKNIMVVVEALFRSALARKECRGSHFLEEYPVTNNRDWLKHILLQSDGQRMRVWTEPVPTPYLRPRGDFSTPAGIRRE